MNQISMKHVILAVAIMWIPQSTSAQNLAEFEKNVTEFTLDNGLTVIILKRDVAPVASFVTYVGVGGANEPVGQTGIAHIFEHMAFKGTTTIGTSDWEKEKPLLEAVNTASVADGAGSQRMGPNSQPLPQMFVEVIEKQVAGHYVNVAQTLASATVTYLGTEDVEGVAAVKLLVEETNTTWYLEPSTALPLRSMSTEFNAMAGMEVESVTIYSNWTLADGVRLAYSESSMMNGQVASSQTITSHSSD